MAAEHDKFTAQEALRPENTSSNQLDLRRVANSDGNSQVDGNKIRSAFFQSRVCAEPTSSVPSTERARLDGD